MSRLDTQIRSLPASLSAGSSMGIRRKETKMTLRFEKAFLPVFLFALAGFAYADTVLYSTGFENPPFHTGSILGQDGWNGSAIVENSIAATGSQAVSVNGKDTAPSEAVHGDPSTGSLIDLSADINLALGTTQTEWEFAGLGLASPGTGFAALLGGIDIQADNVAGLGFSAISAITAGDPVIGLFSRTEDPNVRVWHHVDLLFSMITQTYDVSLDGSLLASDLPFCGDNGPCAGGGAPLTLYGDGSFEGFGRADGTGNDFGYMDNYRVTSAGIATPEPAGVGLLLTALVGMGCAVKRRLETASGRKIAHAIHIVLLCYKLERQMSLKHSCVPRRHSRRPMQWSRRQGSR